MTDVQPAMAPTSRVAPQTVLRNYLHAKDENRPHLTSKVFCKTATLRMRVNTGGIAFPAEALGIDAITDTLVRNFGQTYENVYSFYLDRPPEEAGDFACNWLVGMTEKSNGNVRVGCGAYDWNFDESSGLAARLTITIEAMQSLPASQFEPVFDWLHKLSYPWSSIRDAVALAPPIDALAPVLRYLASKANSAAPE